jgi:cellulose biosynthesis protein BcsQ
MFFDLLQRVPEFLKLDWSTIGKMLLGAFMVAFMAYGWVRAIRKAARAQIASEAHKRSAEIEREKGEFYRQNAELKASHSEEVARLREEVREAEHGKDEARRERELLSVQLASLQERFSALESFDGRLWEREGPSDSAPFVPMSQRQTRFIAMLNLKGGVGKTTLVANLGVALARRGRRVLMADLDFQGSLSRLCASRDDLGVLTRKNATVSRLLRDDAGERAEPLGIVQRLGHPALTGMRCDFIAADDTLAEAELRAQARWLVANKPDARFLLRRAFHRPEVLQQYEFVLFDCPPRLTTACVNALGCCDYLLVPVLLEQGSVETLPRTLRWLTDLPHVSRARLLGVVANRVELYRGQPVAAQGTIFRYLPETVKRSGYDGAAVFRAIVRNSRARIEEAANFGRIAALDDDGLALFSDLANEVEEGARG